MAHIESHEHTGLTHGESKFQLVDEQHTERKLLFSHTEDNPVHCQIHVHWLRDWLLRSLLVLLLELLLIQQSVEEVTFGVVIVCDIVVQTFHHEIVIVVVDAHQER